MERFIHNQNLTHYLDLLEVETDPSERERLRGLLIEEEDRFGARHERARETEMLVARGEARVAQQTLLVAQLEEDGRDTALAQRTLGNMVGLLQVLVAIRDGQQSGVRHLDV